MARAIDPKAKAKRQKIVAAVGAVILVGLLAWRVPQMLAMLDKEPPPGSNPTVATPAPIAPSAPGAPAPAATGAPPTAGELADTDPAPVAGPGQLVSFGRFVSKDPFVQQTGRQCADDAGQTIPCSSGGGSTSGSKRKQPRAEPIAAPRLRPAAAASRTATSSARVSVNGTAQSVAVGGTFPASDPVFRLVAATVRTARIAIAGGSYANGAATMTLRKGRPVTLVNTADGTRYRVVLVSTA